MTDRTHPEAGSTHIIRYALELGLLWIDGDGRDKVREALDALDTLEAQLEAIGAGGVQEDKDLQRRCVECVEWQQTGELREGALRAYAKKHWPWHHDSLQMAERATETQAMRAVASWGTHHAPPAEQQAAPKAAPGEQNTVPAEWLEQAYREGWAACRDAETIGEEAEDWAFGNSTANSRMIDAQQAAPQQEAQEPTEVPYQKLTNEIDLILSDPDTELSIGAKRALLWMRTWVSVPLFTAPQQEAQGPWGYARKMPGCGWGFCSKRQYEEAVADGDETKKLYATPQPAPAPLSRDQIREVFMAHGFTIKEGQTDLKQYVYDAAYALLGTKPAPLSDDVVKDAARYQWLREGNDAKHGAAWHVAVNLYGCEWDTAIDAALAAKGGKV